MIPLADPSRDIKSYSAQIIAAVTRVIEDGPYILGDQVSAFEAAMAKRIGAPGAVGVASGTDALVIGLLALGVAPGDEVITVSHTAGPSVAAIRMVGATPVFVDIEPECYGMDSKLVAAAIGPRTKALLAVHLYGHPLAMDSIVTIAERAGIAVLEDCAQAQEAQIANKRVGAFGAAAAFSFYPTKILGALGDGGMVVSLSPDRLSAARRLRTYGWSKPQYAEIPHGRCSRLDPMQAAVLEVRLANLDAEVVRRRTLAERYNAELRDLPMILPTERSGCRHVYHLYVVRSDARDDLTNYLKNAGIGTGIHYPFPVHRQPGLAEGGRTPAPLTVTENISGEILSLPMFPALTDGEQECVIGAVRSFFGKA